jgi:hypothetical protein
MTRASRRFASRPDAERAGVLTEAKVVRVTARPLAVRAAVSSITERQGLLVLVLACYVAALLLTATGTAPDTWLAVVGGREVAHGLPSVDHLTILAGGARWVDQQWLAQLLFYGVYTGGGLLLIALMSATFAFAAIVGAATVARWRGANMRATVWVAAVAMVPYLLPAEVPRAQTLACPLFVAVAWLLIQDSVQASRRVLLVLPILALWANLHGSVLVAICLVALHGLWLLRTRPLVGGILVTGSLACVFASPYATGLPHYYRSTLFNSSFKLLSEWGPTTLKLETVPLFVLMFAAAYVYGRARRLFTPTETIIVLVTAVAALHAVRFTVWFALAALMILPRPIASLMQTQPPPPHLNRLCGRLGIAAIVGVLGIVVLKGVAGYPTAASAAVTSAAGDTSAVFASELYGDWLLTVAPSLRGRVAYDSRIELLSANVVGRIQLAQATGLGWQDLSDRYPVFVLNASDERNLIADLSRAGYAPRYQHGSLVVMARP